MSSICGANCNECEMFKDNRCKGCEACDACPCGKKCFIAKYIDIGGIENYEKLKQRLIDEFNALNIDGMTKIHELYPLRGDLVNLEYTLPNGNKVKFLDDQEIYLGNQVPCEFNDAHNKTTFGLIANLNFILVCEYEKEGENPEIIIYKRR